MFTPDIQHKLETARLHETAYTPNQAVVDNLKNQTLIMLTGPVAVGKTFIMNRVVALDNNFARVSTLTTRDPRPDDDPGMFRTIPHDDQHISNILQKIAAGELVQYAVHPTTGRLYASELQDFPAKYNLLAMLSETVEHLQTLPFEKTYAIGLATDPLVWQKRLDSRYPRPSEEKQKRLREAVASLTWLLTHKIIWIDNTNDNDDTAAQQLINIVKHGQDGSSPEATAHACAMLQLIEGML